MSFESVLNGISRSYLFTRGGRELVKFAKANLRDVDFDRDAWLHKAGLATYTPAKSTFTGVSLFLFGAIAGGVAALALAPKTGKDFRADVKDTAMDLLNRTDLAQKPEKRVSA